MNKTVLSGILAFVCVVGVMVADVKAQVSDIDPLEGVSGKCVNLSTDLRITSTGNAVSDLQFFLQAKGYLDSEPTGYFGLLTQAAVIKYQLDNAISGTGFVGQFTRESINSKSCSTATTNTTAKLSASVAKKVAGEPSVTLSAQSRIGDVTNMLVDKGETIIFSGKPENLKGVRNGKSGFTAAWIYDDEVIGSCKKARLSGVGSWKLKCEGLKMGTTDVHVEIYKDGKTYVSNAVRVTVGEEGENNGKDIDESVPVITMVHGTADSDFVVTTKGAAVIEGSDLVSAGKDAEIYINGEEIRVTKFGERALHFVAPNLSSGTYDLKVRTTAGWSNVVKVVIDGDKKYPIIKKIGGKYSEAWELNANEYTYIEGTDLVSAGKDARVFFGDTEAAISRYDNNMLYIKVPYLETGVYSLRVETSEGISESVLVRVNAKG